VTRSQRSLERRADGNGRVDEQAVTPTPAPAAELSELEVALLALLSIRPMTGYEIQRRNARALEPWWETPRTQIYPKLRALEKRGLVEHEQVVQEGKPNKRLYSLCSSGAEALSHWLGSSIAAPEMRHHMMMRLFLGNLMPVQQVCDLLGDYRDRMAARAESLRSAKERFARSLSGPYRASVFFELLSLDHLIAMTDLEVSGTDKALAALRGGDLSRALSSSEQAGELLDAIHDVS
jgi:DNA-binding PadR family transcriptional regulator